MIREFAWRAIARVVTTETVSNWLMNRASATPYTHIRGKDGSLYMGRWWLFNPYPHEESSPAEREKWDRSWRAMLPSARVHWIRRPDADRHCHDHPWDARTIVMRNGYDEERPVKLSSDDLTGMVELIATPEGPRAVFRRERGYTGRLLFGQYHRISHIPEGGAWTLFITWKKQGTWGFLVDGVKVPWRKYLGLDQA